MNIKVNGQWVESDAVSVEALIRERNHPRPEILVVELNGRIVPRACWDAAKLSSRDAVEILSFVGGG